MQLRNGIKIPIRPTAPGAALGILRGELAFLRSSLSVCAAQNFPRLRPSHKVAEGELAGKRDRIVGKS